MNRILRVLRRWRLLCIAPIAPAASAALRNQDRAGRRAGRSLPLPRMCRTSACHAVLVAQRASWVMSNFVTRDTRPSRPVRSATVELVTRLERESRRYLDLPLGADLRRKFALLRLSLSAPAPDDAAQRSAGAVARRHGRRLRPRPLVSAGPGRTLPDPRRPRSRARHKPRPQALRDAWAGWRTVAPAYRDDYTRFVTLSNAGARGAGYADLGALWRSGYDMPADAFPQEMERLWQQVKPLYDSLHTYTRYKLIQQYGDEARRADRLIPAHLLGNMWAQAWGSLYPMLKPQQGDAGDDLGAALAQQKADGRADPLCRGFLHLAWPAETAGLHSGNARSSTVRRTAAWSVMPAALVARRKGRRAAQDVPPSHRRGLRYRAP